MTMVQENGCSPSYHNSVKKVKELINSSGLVIKNEKSKEKLRNKILNFQKKVNFKRREKSGKKSFGKSMSSKGLIRKISELKKFDEVK